MKKIAAIIRKEVSHLLRDRRSLMIIFFMPVVQLLILGFASNLDIKALPMLVVDQDRSAASRSLVERFTATEYFLLKETTTDLRAMDEAVNANRVSMALVIPRGFGAAVAAGRPVGVEVVFDGSESYTAGVGVGYSSIIIAGYASRLLENSLLRNPRSGTGRPLIDARTRIWFNPELQSRKFLIPGIMAMLIMLVTILLTSLAIVKEKEQGTLEQLIVTPVRPAELVIGKLTPFLVIGLADMALVTLESWIIFGVTMTGSLILFFALSVLFILSTLGIGFLVSTLSQNQQQAMLASIFFFILPMILLSGFVFPISNMPLVIQAVTYILPLRYFFIIIRGIFLKGAGLAEFWDEILALFVLSAVLYGLAILRFRKRLD